LECRHPIAGRGAEKRLELIAPLGMPSREISVATAHTLERSDDGGRRLRRDAEPPCVERFVEPPLKGERAKRYELVVRELVN